jgi:Tfp pilus assembly protein FimT
MTKKLLLLAILLSLCVPIFAQSVDTAWVRTYNRTVNDADVARAMALDSSGNVSVQEEVAGSRRW